MILSLSTYCLLIFLQSLSCGAAAVCPPLLLFQSFSPLVEWAPPLILGHQNWKGLNQSLPCLALCCFDYWSPRTFPTCKPSGQHLEQHPTVLGSELTWLASRNASGGSEQTATKLYSTTAKPCKCLGARPCMKEILHSYANDCGSSMQYKQS